MPKLRLMSGRSVDLEEGEMALVLAESYATQTAYGYIATASDDEVMAVAHGDEDEEHRDDPG